MSLEILSNYKEVPASVVRITIDYSHCGTLIAAGAYVFRIDLCDLIHQANLSLSCTQSVTSTVEMEYEASNPSVDAGRDNFGQRRDRGWFAIR